MTIYHSSRVYLESLPMKEEKLLSSVGSFADGLFLSLSHVSCVSQMSIHSSFSVSSNRNINVSPSKISLHSWELKRSAVDSSEMFWIITPLDTWDVIENCSTISSRHAMLLLVSWFIPLLWTLDPFSGREDCSIISHVMTKAESKAVTKAVAKAVTNQALLHCSGYVVKKLGS